MSGRSPNGAAPSSLRSTIPLAKRLDSSLTPKRGFVSPGVLTRRCLSDKMWRAVRPPIRTAAMGSGSGPNARPVKASETHAGRKCTSKSRKGYGGSPLYTELLSPMQDSRWSLSSAPLSKEFFQSSTRSKRLPRVDRETLKAGMNGHAETKAGTSVLSLRRRLFGAAVARKSMALYSINPGVTGGILSKRTLVEISFPYLAQKCDLCEVILETAVL